jgi:hypothetical protein
VRVLHAVKAGTGFRLLLLCVYGISPSIKSSMFLGTSIRGSFYIDAFVGLDTCFLRLRIGHLYHRITFVGVSFKVFS